MSRFKRREPFGKAGLTVAVLALVLAMVGGAYAASKLNGTQKKEVEKIAKKYAGKPGVAGANGTNGSPGAKGDVGAAGPAGAPGKDGIGVTGTESNTTIDGTHCVGVGGSKFVTASATTYACNGKQGKEGTFGGESLPTGKTLRGVWALSGTGSAKTGVSFALQVSPEPHQIVIGFEEGEGEPNEADAIKNGECTGTFNSPGAAEGKLCLFVEFSENAFGGVPFLGLGGTPEAVYGFRLTAVAAAPGTVSLSGSWAVTGE